MRCRKYAGSTGDLESLSGSAVWLGRRPLWRRPGREELVAALGQLGVSQGAGARPFPGDVKFEVRGVCSKRRWENGKVSVEISAARFLAQLALQLKEFVDGPGTCLLEELVGQNIRRTVEMQLRSFGGRRGRFEVQKAALIQRKAVK